MNNLKLNINIPSLGSLESVGLDTYALVAKFYKADGSNLDSPNIENSNDVTVTTTSTNFAINIPIVNADWGLSDVQIRAFGNSENPCCFALRIDDIINTFSPSITPEAVIINQFEKVSRYEPSTGQLATLFTATGVLSADIAHTSNKLWIYQGDSTTMTIKEYDITSSPFSHVFNKDYTIDISYYGSGLCATSNTKLYIAGDKVYEITLSGSTALPVEMFSLPAGYSCTGDIIYDTSTNLMLISYDDLTDFRIGVFNASTGAVVRSAVAPANDIFGIYQFGGDTFIIGGDGQIYELNLSTLASTAGATIPITGPSAITGGSQIQSNISIPS